MAWSIAQVARMSKVTSRTLRHYDEIGLLPPAWVGGNGYRYYEQEQLLRLQQILVMRELGLGLDAIKEIVRHGRDQAEVLRMHRGWLLAERDRFARLARTVTRTIEELEGGENVTSMDHWFEGFDSAKQAELTEEARQRWGAEQVDAANAHVRGKSKEWWQSQGRQWAEQVGTLVALIDAGHQPGDAEVLDALDGHYRWLCGYWTPNRESYTGLGDLYADDPRFRANFDRTDPRLAEFMRAAMAAYAQARL
ncbi:MerR family transcriptional regulator [Actinophytocola oryzae]|uniref:DNA-binding transcriptional MerR regulator n=1 Tax=Actinophytocola oryzae TaxID=502181 RepID=A0A4R7VCW0_9PSEU|nr:MerR family transcriptional regulator [Actinophytocola oryzae]TDV46944.1 DNA-binding transcriptional MerR regulator [Actinophytocola oryzae]